MKRSDFKKIIKIRSQWKITGINYTLPSNDRLSEHIRGLVETQLKIDNLAILENGDLCFATGGEWNDTAKQFEDYKLMPDFKENETCDFYKMEKRIDALIYEIVQKQ